MADNTRQGTTFIYRTDKTFRQILNAYQSGKRILFKIENNYQEEDYQRNNEGYFLLNEIYSTVQNNETLYIIKAGTSGFLYLSCALLDDYPSTEGGK